MEQTAPAVSSTASEKSERPSSSRYGVLSLVVIAAAAATVWALRGEKAGDTSTHEVAEQDPIVSPAHKDRPDNSDRTDDSTTEKSVTHKSANANPTDDSKHDDEQADSEAKPKVEKAEVKSAKTGLVETSSTPRGSKAAEDDAKPEAAETNADDKDTAPETDTAEAPKPVLPPFDQAAARAALGAAAAQAAACRKGDDPTGNAEVLITFAPSGRVTSANVSGGPFAGTATGGCVASTLRRAKVPPFSGTHVTVSKTVHLR